MSILCAFQSHVQKNVKNSSVINLERFQWSKISKHTALSQLNILKKIKKSIICEKYYCWINLKSLWNEPPQGVIFAENITFLNIKTGELNLKILLLNYWHALSCLRVSRNIFSASRWIYVSEKSHHRCLKGSFLLNLSEGITFFLNIKTGEWDLNIYCLITEMILSLAQ